MSRDNLKTYLSHKTVRAGKIIEIEEVVKGNEYVLSGEFGNISVDIDYVNKHNPKVGGYYVLYNDGYESFSPAAHFEDGYNEI